MSKIDTGWWLKNHLQTYESQWEGLSHIHHILWKIKNVWNHQPGYEPPLTSLTTADPRFISRYYYTTFSRMTFRCDIRLLANSKHFQRFPKRVQLLIYVYIIIIYWLLVSTPLKHQPVYIYNIWICVCVCSTHQNSTQRPSTASKVNRGVIINPEVV